MTGNFVRSALLTLMIACAKQPPPNAPARAPVIDPVHFDTGSSQVTPAEEAAIDRAAEVLKDSSWTVLVLGLADATGDAAVNKALSLQRAEAVAARLRSKVSVPTDRIVVHAIGERLATGASVSERKVEFVFFEPQGLDLKEMVVRSGVLREDFRKAR